MFNNNKSDDMFAGITRDESIDLSAFVKKSADSGVASATSSIQDTHFVAPKATTAVTGSIQDTHFVAPKATTAVIDAAAVLGTNLSPLEKELEKKKSGTSGLSITKEEYESGLERTEFKSIVDSDQRNQDLIDIQNESDQLLLQRQAVVPLKQYDGSAEFTQMVHEISRVKFDENGKAYFEQELDDEGNNIIPSLVRLRTEDDPPFSKENDFMILRGENNAQNDDVEMSDELEDEEESDDASPENTKKKKVVQFLIDKTGLGADFVLTEEDKKKLVDSNEIRLKQVETLDIQSITTTRPDRESFTGHIHSHQLSSHRTTISFPASGFKADMQGLTYGEVGDISLSMETVNVDKYYKRMAIIYNKMKNISSGPFESFEDFLKGFAYTDIPLALYGIYVSTYPEVQTISLRCGRKDCAKSFDWTFSTRNILKLEKSEEEMLEKMAELASADPFQYDEIFEKAPVRNSKLFKLPYCGYIVEIGIASAYEFLYNFIIFAEIL